ncbi:hypothetical protein O3297_16460 [Janthinobacterium sp. SUN128]|uniref:hypothetical protein n=1 Tax=Janthinobacterium sp. SUN128 TaxID=3014790 RepID=UPI0027133DC1|nr:hypothetical protein [Janthinobacterium sp. SUN128]MDO8035008.1 hypothetical protein [Janthinobacterium sp. SUN128]
MTIPPGLAAPDNDAPVSPLTWLTLASLLVAGLAWYWFSSHALPRCDARQTVAAVTDGKFSLHAIKQAGYAWSQKTRGCLATVIQDGKPMQYAWTISRVEGRRKSRLEYDHAHPGIVQTRFADIAWHGGFAQQGQPIGRDGLKNAMLAGMDALRGKPLYHVNLNAVVSPQHYREIGDIEALGPCKEVLPGVVSCRLLLARNDLAPAAATKVLAVSVLQQGDFTFQRSEDGKNWSVTPRFKTELEQAQLQ